MSRLSLSCVVLALCACSAPPPDQVARASAAIINGEPSDQADDSAIAIPLFQDGNFVGACSGVLIAPNLVLTARHCVSDSDETSACDVDGTPLEGGTVYSDHNASDLGVITGATLKFMLDSQGKQIFTPTSDTLCNQDIALLLLDQPITTVPIAQFRLDGPPVAGEKIRSVGWGVSNNSQSYGRRRRDDVTILEVGPMVDAGGLGGIGPNEFEVGESICSGDSGGPAFAETTRAVLGIVSRGGNGVFPGPNDPDYAACVDSGGHVTRNLYTRVDGFRGLLDQAFAAAGAEPWLEGGPDPRKAKTGEACTGNDACRSGICVDPTATGYCSQTCDDTPGACPTALTCQEQDGAKICKTPHHGCAMTPGARPSGAWTWLLALVAALVVRRRRALG